MYNNKINGRILFYDALRYHYKKFSLHLYRKTFNIIRVQQSYYLLVSTYISLPLATSDQPPAHPGS